MNQIVRPKLFNAVPLPETFYVAREKDVRHLIGNGSLVYTWLDIEATDKEWMHLEATVASLTTTDIAYNLLSDDLYEVCVPDRILPSAEAMMVTRYFADKIRDPQKMSPQYAVAKIFEDVQAAPLKLWNNLGNARDMLGLRLWQSYIDEQTIEVTGKTGKKKPVLVRHMPLLNDRNEIVKTVRVHEPSPTREFMQMSYLTQDAKYDYEDDHGRWRTHDLDKFNLGFRNTYFDNRVMAQLLYRAGFSQKELYAMNKKGLGNHAVDAFTIALSNYFFSTNGRERLSLGERRDELSNESKLSAKLDLIMDNNTRFEDEEIGMPEGVRVYGGTLHNLKKGHNDPGYDNAKAIAVHAYNRLHDSDLLIHVESLGNIDYFRRFMTFDMEDGIPTTNPLRFIVASADDNKIYRPAPVIVLGSDDYHGKFNRIWTMRADIDYRTYEVEGKLLTDMSEEELAAVIKSQRGRIGAVFHEINLKRHRGAIGIQAGLDAGHCPNHSIESLRFMRDYIVEHYDDHDRAFLGKVTNAFARQHSFAPPMDDVMQPYVEEEIWTALGEVKYTYIKTKDDEIVRLPNIIRDMAQNEFERINKRLGDSMRALLRPQPLELAYTEENAVKYVKLRMEQDKKIQRYQKDYAGKKAISLSPPGFDLTFLRDDFFPVPIDEIYSMLIEDKYYLMDKVPETTRYYEVQQLLPAMGKEKWRWQTIPFNELSVIPEHQLVGLKDDGRLRISFEKNPNHPTYRFMIRYFMENGLGSLLTEKQRDFYMAETAFYVQGHPGIKNPMDHKPMSLPKQRVAVERIKSNQHTGIPYLHAGWAGEIGAYETFAKDDMQDAILDSVERDARRIAKKYPMSDKTKLLFGIDPALNRVMPHVKYEIPSKHLIVPVADWHTEMTASHPLYGPVCLVVRNVPKIKNARYIVLEEEATKRRFLAAEPIINPMPPRNGAFEEFYDKIDAAYSQSGASTPTDGYVLSCAELVPVSKTKDPKYPALYVSQDKLIATRNPQRANLQRKQPLSGFILRKYDLELQEKQKIRLRARSAEGRDTGWETTATIKRQPQSFTMKQLLQNLEDPGKRIEMQRMAFVCGFGTTDHMKAAMLEEFTRFDENIHDDENILLFFEIEPVKKITHWTPKQPRACFERKPQKKPRRMKKQSPAVSLAGKKKLHFVPGFTPN